MRSLCKVKSGAFYDFLLFCCSETAFQQRLRLDFVLLRMHAL
jgi:hypothetical protein